MRIDDFISGVIDLAKANGKIIISNPYQIEKNDQMTLDGGFGILVGDATPHSPSFSNNDPSIALDREIGLVFVAQNIGDKEDYTCMVNREATVRNEAYSFFSQIKNDRNLSSVVLGLNISSDSKEFIGGENDEQYLVFTLTIIVTNKESF